MSSLVLGLLGNWGLRRLATPWSSTAQTAAVLSQIRNSLALSPCVHPLSRACVLAVCSSVIGRSASGWGGGFSCALEARLLK